MDRHAIPSYMLYGEAYGGRFPDCLHCETISERSRLHDWHIRPHRHHGLHQFLWIARGTVTVSTDASRHRLQAPVAVMNAPAAVQERTALGLTADYVRMLRGFGAFDAYWKVELLDGNCGASPPTGTMNRLPTHRSQSNLRPSITRCSRARVRSRLIRKRS